MFLRKTCLTSFSLVLLCAIGELDVYSGIEPIECTSPIFSASLTQNGTSWLYPHVYYTKTNSTNYNSTITHLQAPFYNRSVSWIEFGQLSNDETLININLINTSFYQFYFNNNTNNKILPSRHDIIVEYVNQTSLSFSVKSNFLSLSLEYGYCNLSNLSNQSSIEKCNKSSFKHSFLIFIGNSSNNNDYINKNDTLYIKAGVHNITNPNNGNGGILTTNISTIYFERGAFVYGKIVCAIPNRSVCNIIGYGILAGTHFSYINRFNDEDDWRQMINSTWSPLNLMGLTVIDPSQYGTISLPQYSTLKSYKQIAWYYNNDGVTFNGHSSITHSFIRTNDDSIKMQYGSNNIANENVIWQLFNGSPYQMGWVGNGCEDCVINNTDIIHTEWRGNYKGDTSNDAVININGPYLDPKAWTQRRYTNIRIENVKIDSFIGRFIGIIFSDILDGNEIIVENWKISNVQFNVNEQWFCSFGYGPQFLNISNDSINNKSNVSISNIEFHNIYQNNIHILNDKSWNLQINDDNQGRIYNITYT
eukprot:154933_1